MLCTCCNYICCRSTAPQARPRQSQKELIAVHGDGRCLYRAVACHGASSLRSCGRSSWGTPLNAELAALEQRLADSIRKDVAFLLKNEMKASEKHLSLPMILEGPRGQPYPSIERKIRAIENPSEYAGYLEITAIAFITKRQIHIYEERGKTFELLMRIPTETFPDGIPIEIVYYSETLSRGGHYNLPVPCSTDTTCNVWSIARNESVFMNCDKHTDNGPSLYFRPIHTIY